MSRMHMLSPPVSSSSGERESVATGAAVAAAVAADAVASNSHINGVERSTYAAKMKAPADRWLDSDDNMQPSRLHHNKRDNNNYNKSNNNNNYNNNNHAASASASRQQQDQQDQHIQPGEIKPPERSSSQVSMATTTTNNTFDSAGLDLLGDVSLGEMAEMVGGMKDYSELSRMSSIVSAETTDTKKWLPPTRGWSLNSMDSNSIVSKKSALDAEMSLASKKSAVSFKGPSDWSGTDALSPPVRRNDDDYFTGADDLRPILVRHDDSSKSFASRSSARPGLMSGLSQSSVATFSVSSGAPSISNATMNSIDAGSISSSSKPSFLSGKNPLPLYSQNRAELEAVLRLSRMQNAGGLSAMSLETNPPPLHGLRRHDADSPEQPPPHGANMMDVDDDGAAEEGLASNNYNPKRKALDITTSNEDMRATITRIQEQEILAAEQQKRSRNLAMKQLQELEQQRQAMLGLEQLDLTSPEVMINIPVPMPSPPPASKPTGKPRVVKQPEQLQYFDKTDRDVIFGRGNGPNAHNSFFREQVLIHRQAYFDGHNAEKLAVVDRLFEWVGTNGGRFLDKDDRGWYQVTNRAAFTKIRQMIRENKTAQERQQQQEKA